MIRAGVLAAATLLAACSAGGDSQQGARDTPTRTDAAAIVRAYAQDADEAGAAFAGHPLLISGDVVSVDRDGHHLLLTTGTATERLFATLTSSPEPISAHDLVVLRCDRIDRKAEGPKVSGCAITALIPARIAQGG